MLTPPGVPNKTVTSRMYNAFKQDAFGGSSLLAHQQLGAITLPTNPSNTQTLTLVINGTSIIVTFVTSIGTAANNVLRGATAAATATNLLQFLQNPQTTNSTQVAASLANQNLLSYIYWSLIVGGTTITPASANNTLYAPLASFSASTTATGGAYTASTVKLYIQPGTAYVNGTRVLFNGASTPAFSAPASNPRIDVVLIDNTGALSITTGSENASPTAPAYPADKVAICEVYNVVGQTSILNYDNQSAGQGYVYNDVRPIVGMPFNPGAIPDSLIPSADGTLDLGSGSFQWNNIYAKTSIKIAGVNIAVAKFGGTGSDGALSISSGTTTINAGSARVVIKNYTSIAITGTAALTISSPNANGTILVLRSQGGVTLTSSNPNIVMDSMGGIAGTAASNAPGVVGNDGLGNIGTAGGGGAGGQGNGGVGAAGAAGTSPKITPTVLAYGLPLVPGAGGASGGSPTGSSTASGAGGRGGGALLIECAGALNYTGSISATGANGSNGGALAGSTGPGAGGGGGGGCVIILYGTLTANSGTTTVTGGSGGTGQDGTGSGAGGGGGGGGSVANVGTVGLAGVNSGGGNTGGMGGNGGAGASLVAANTQLS